MKEAENKSRTPKMASYPQKLGEAYDKFSLMASGGTSPADSLILNFWPPHLGENKVVSNHLRLQNCVTAAIANECILCLHIKTELGFRPS